MAKYTTIKAEAQKRHEALFEKCHVFWAFSREQFDEGKKKHPLIEGEKYVAIGMGGYMPKRYHAELVKGLKEIDDWRKAEIKKAKAEEVILYELNNYECFYSGDISDAMEVLGDTYTEDEVLAVYRKYVGKPTSPKDKANEVNLS